MTTSGERVALTHRFTLALDYAAIVHAGQVRKGTDGIPYVAHLLAVASLVLENGGNEEVAIAALLHDAAEDQGGEARLRDIETRFGARIAELVRECSDSLRADADNKDPWHERKRQYLDRLRQSADRDYLLVSWADKLHNARAILQAHRDMGDRVWDRFKEKGKTRPPEEILGYYDACAEAFQDKSEDELRASLARELRATVDLVARESGKTPDRRWERRE